MQDNVIYKENRASTGIFIILLMFTMIMIFFLGYQLMYGPIGSKPAPDWILALFVVFFLLTTLNFSHLRIKLTDDFIRVNYGLIGTKLNWADVLACEEDEKNYFYGWGIRFGRYKKQWVWIYNVIGGPRVVFLTDKKKPKGLIISTKNPQEILRIAGSKIPDQ